MLFFDYIAFLKLNNMKKILAFIVILFLCVNAFSQVSQNCSSFTIHNSVSQKRIGKGLCVFNILLNPSSQLWLGIAENQVAYIYPKNFDEDNIPKIDVEYCKDSVLKVDFRLLDFMTVHSIINKCEIIPIKIPNARPIRQ